MPEYLMNIYTAKDLAETPTDSNRQLVLDAVRYCAEISNDDLSTIVDKGDWGYVVEYLQDAGTPVPIGQLMGALMGR
jgi:hypothetical protein